MPSDPNPSHLVGEPVHGPQLARGIYILGQYDDGVGNVVYQGVAVDEDGNVRVAALPAGPAIIGKVDSAISTPTVYNVTCTNADTEYSQALPVNCRKFELQARTEAILRFAFVTGKVATPVAPWLTLKAGDYYYSPDMMQTASPSTLFVASPMAGTVVEILAWT